MCFLRDFTKLTEGLERFCNWLKISQPS